MSAEASFAKPNWVYHWHRGAWHQTQRDLYAMFDRGTGAWHVIAGDEVRQPRCSIAFAAADGALHFGIPEGIA